MNNVITERNFGKYTFTKYKSGMNSLLERSLNLKNFVANDNNEIIAVFRLKKLKNDGLSY